MNERKVAEGKNWTKSYFCLWLVSKTHIALSFSFDESLEMELKLNCSFFFVPSEKFHAIRTIKNKNSFFFISFHFIYLLWLHLFYISQKKMKKKKTGSKCLKFIVVTIHLITWFTVHCSWYRIYHRISQIETKTETKTKKKQ